MRSMLLSAGVAVLIFAAAAEAQSRDRTKPRKRPAKTAPATQPAPEPEPATGPAMLTRIAAQLARMPKHERTHDKLALQAGLGFLLAVSQADGDRAARWLDATGYQPLPLEGPLREAPGRPVAATELTVWVQDRAAESIGDLPPEAVEAWSRHQTRPAFAAVAQWMLPQDYAVVFRVARDDRRTKWLTRDALVVVRVRGARATVMGGNLLEALSLADQAAPPDAPPAPGA